MLTSILNLNENNIQAFPEKLVETSLSLAEIPEELQEQVIAKLELKGVTEITSIVLLTAMYRNISMIVGTNTGKVSMTFAYSFREEVLNHFKFTYQRLEDSDPAPLETLIDYKFPLTE